MGIVLPLAAMATAVSPARAETPALIWQNVDEIGVQCVVRASPSAMRDALQAMLCERVRAVASPGAPAPVTLRAIGDPAILDPGGVTLLVHASAESEADGWLVAFSIRPFRVSAEQSSVLYGAAPRAATIPNSGAASPALNAAIAAALSETLPWLDRSHHRGVSRQ